MSGARKKKPFAKALVPPAIAAAPPFEVPVPEGPGIEGPARQRVLLVSLFHPELTRGGAQQICYELFGEMKRHADIEPILLASDDGTYPVLYKSGARITGFDGREGEYMFLSRDYDHWWHKTSSRLLIEAFVEFLETIRPDVVHFHHFLTFGIDLLTLTRRVLPEARLVFTFHEFLAICAADGHMVRKTDRSLCTHASPIRCHQCIPERGPEQFLMRKMWFMRHFSVVDAFTCPSPFMVEHFTRWGIEADKITVVTNGQKDHSHGIKMGPASAGHNRFGFFGQLVDVKGVQVILRAVRILRFEGFEDFVIELNGENLRYASAAVREEIEGFLQEEAARSPEKRIVTYNGGYHVDQLRSRMSRVDWCIVPSIWWESFGLVISEAWMFGRPVICSNVGGPASRIRDDVDGLHFEIGNAGALAATIRRACTEPGLWERLTSALPPAPSTAVMMAGYRSVYAREKQMAALA